MGVPSAYFTEILHHFRLIAPGIGVFRQARIHEIFEAGHLPKAVLPPELIEAWYAMLPIANQIECRYVDLLGRARQPVHLQILQEARVVL
jgi:hypothetical protein